MSAATGRISKPALFAFLMTVSALVALLPPAWTRWVRGLIQPIGWLQWPLVAGTRRVSDGTTTAAGSAPGRDAYDRAVAELEGLRRQVGHQQLIITELEKQLADVTGIRGQLHRQQAGILIASVVAFDASPRRDALTIARGENDGIRVGQWVAAGLPPDQLDPQATGRDLLIRQWIIGRVIEAHPYLSRVQLCTDPAFGPLRVRAARINPNGVWETAKGECLLYGRGGGGMQIRDATADYVKQGYPAIVVPLGGNSTDVMTLGWASSATPLPEAALHYNLDVRPWGDQRGLTHVYVVDLGP
jgi:hypothetical protein